MPVERSASSSRLREIQVRARQRAVGGGGGAPLLADLRAADATKRPQRGHQINRFKDVGLALRVVAEQQVEAGRKIHVQPRVVAEVTESQMSQMHAEKMRWRGGGGEIFPRGIISVAG